MDTSSPAALVNAEILNMFVGRRVRTVVQVQRNEGGVVVGQSSDGHQLSIKTAMDVPVSHFMEVYGIAENNQTIRAEVCTDFGPNFDGDKYASEINRDLRMRFRMRNMLSGRGFNRAILH